MTAFFESHFRHCEFHQNNSFFTFSLAAESVEPDYNLQVASVVQEELVEEGDSDRQSHMSGISQQDRDNKTILLRQAASGKLFKILGKYRDYYKGS